MDGIASVRHQHDVLSRQAMMCLLTMGWSRAHTSLAITPEHSTTNGENSSLTSARAGHSRSMCLSSPKAPVHWKAVYCHLAPILDLDDKSKHYRSRQANRRSLQGAVHAPAIRNFSPDGPPLGARISDMPLSQTMIACRCGISMCQAVLSRAMHQDSAMMMMLAD